MTSRTILLAISDKLATRTDSGQERPRLVDTDVVVHCQPLMAFLAVEFGFADLVQLRGVIPPILISLVEIVDSMLKDVRQDGIRTCLMEVCRRSEVSQRIRLRYLQALLILVSSKSSARA